jgi:hypothetical protein
MDLDWEYPATPERGGRESDTANQVSLVKEMREAFGDKYGISSILARTTGICAAWIPRVWRARLTGLISWVMICTAHGMATFRYVYSCLERCLESRRGPVLTTWLDARRKDPTTH